MDATTQAVAVTLDQVEALLAKPLLELVFEAATVHRAHHDPARVQCSQLLSIKTGGCPEDCGYCSQSAHHETPVEREPLMEVDQVLAAEQPGERLLDCLSDFVADVRWTPSISGFRERIHRRSGLWRQVPFGF